jgi:hypothetical protein
MGKQRFSSRDAPWIEETAWIYMHHGLYQQFPNDKKLVDRVVKAFERRYGRPPKWNTPHENERLIALDTERASTLPLLDLDRQPQLEGLYVTAVTEWARIAGLRASKIRESIDGRKVRIELVVGGKKRELTARLYRHGQFDLTILTQMNKLVPKGRALRVVESNGHEPITLIVSLDAKGARDIQVNRGVRFWGPPDFKRMTAVFADREKHWAAEADDDE